MAKFLRVEDEGSALIVALGEACKELRRNAKLTQADLADKAGMTPSYLSELENGRANPTLEMIEGLANAFGMTAIELLQYKN